MTKDLVRPAPFIDEIPEKSTKKIESMKKNELEAKIQNFNKGKDGLMYDFDAIDETELWELLESFVQSFKKACLTKEKATELENAGMFIDPNHPPSSNNRIL